MRHISVIIACYNAVGYLERCIKSLLDQTIGFDSLEVIFVDDNSTDNTWDELLGLEKKYPDEIIAVHSDVNGRQGMACNIGLDYASCDWIAYIDQDDWIEPTYLEKLLSKGIEYDCDMVCCRYKRDFSNEPVCFEDVQTGKDDRLVIYDTVEKVKAASIFMEIPYYCWGKLIKRSFLLENELFYPIGVVYEDNLWGSLLPFYVKSVYFLEEFLYHYYVNDTSTVLNKTSDYHLDLLTVQLRFMKTCEERGLTEQYGEEIEYNFLYNCYLSFMKILANRYCEPNYSHFLLLKEIVLLIAPEWKKNRYIAGGTVKEFHMALFELLDKDIDKNTFAGVIEAVRKSGI